MEPDRLKSKYLGAMTGAIAGAFHGEAGLAAVGGLLISQLVTLYLTPVVFTYLDDPRQFVRRKVEALRGSKSLPATPVEAQRAG